MGHKQATGLSSLKHSDANCHLYLVKEKKIEIDTGKEEKNSIHNHLG